MAAALDQVLINIQAEKNVCPHFQSCSALSKITVSDFSSALLKTVGTYFTLNTDKRPITALLF